MKIVMVELLNNSSTFSFEKRFVKGDLSDVFSIEHK